ncbi:hypothetical protein WEI85_24105 [Actinomycetes bacterium KLBMP 9797]
MTGLRDDQVTDLVTAVFDLLDGMWQPVRARKRSASDANAVHNGRPKKRMNSNSTLRSLASVESQHPAPIDASRYWSTSSYS